MKRSALGDIYYMAALWLTDHVTVVAHVNGASYSNGWPYTCQLVKAATNGRTGPMLRYGQMFCPVASKDPCWEHFDWWGGLPTRENDNYRLTALCFAIAMADAGDL